MPEDKLFDDDDFQVDENGDRVKDEDGNDIPKPEEKEEGGEEKKEEEEEKKEEEKKEEKKETPEEENARLKKENVGLKTDIGEHRRRTKTAETELVNSRKPKRTKEEQEDHDAEPMTRGEFAKERKRLKEEVRTELQNEKDAQDLADARNNDENFTKIEKMALEVMKGDTDWDQAYSNTKNIPAFYRKLAKMHPDYTADVKKETTSKVVKSIKKAGEKVSTGAGAGKGKDEKEEGEFDGLTMSEFAEMTPKQQDAVPDRIQEKLLGAND